MAEQAGRGSEDNGAGRYEPIRGGKESSMAERQGKVGRINYRDYYNLEELSFLLLPYWIIYHLNFWKHNLRSGLLMERFLSFNSTAN